MRYAEGYNPFTGDKLSSKDMKSPVSIYVKVDCPYSTQLMIFLGESGLKDKVIVNYDTIENRDMLRSLTGKAQFPVILLPTATSDTGTDDTKNLVAAFETEDLVNFFSTKFSIDVDSLPAYKLYTGEDGLKSEYLKFVNKLADDFKIDVPKYTKQILEDAAKIEYQEQKQQQNDRKFSYYLTQPTSLKEFSSERARKSKYDAVTSEGIPTSIDVFKTISKNNIDIYLQKKRLSSKSSIIDFFE